ncbi:MAG: hypothetical protein ABIV13_01355 [Fimbriimonadales bacterium]
MQIVDFRDGKLRFRLPKRWTAEYLPDGGAIFREPEGIGVLFLNTVEIDGPDGVLPAHAFDFLAKHAGHEGREVLQLNNGNALVSFIEKKDGMTSFAWEIVHALPPNLLRLAAFSFAVKEDSHKEQTVIEIVSMLTREIANASFGSD